MHVAKPQNIRTIFVTENQEMQTDLYNPKANRDNLLQDSADKIYHTLI